MKNNTVPIASLLAVLLIGAAALTGTPAEAVQGPRTITVPDDYQRIQDAVNAVNPGDTILVKEGTYNEDYITLDKSVYLFGEKGGQTDHHMQLARELITEFTEVSSKIKFKEYDLKHKNAAKWGVRRSPTLVFEPDLYRIHYLGVPLGDTIFVPGDVLILYSRGDSVAELDRRRRGRSGDARSHLLRHL